MKGWVVWYVDGSKFRKVDVPNTLYRFNHLGLPCEVSPDAVQVLEHNGRDHYIRIRSLTCYIGEHEVSIEVQTTPDSTECRSADATIDRGGVLLLSFCPD